MSSFLLQNATVLLQNATVQIAMILLQIATVIMDATFITNSDSTGLQMYKKIESKSNFFL